VLVLPKLLPILIPKVKKPNGLRVRMIWPRIKLLLVVEGVVEVEEGGRRRLNASYLEDDDDYDGVNLGRLKRQTMRGDRDNYSEDEEELDYGQDSASSEEDEWSKKKTQKRGAAAAKAARKESEEEESSEDGEVVL
jgi:hypothetical protein